MLKKEITNIGSIKAKNCNGIRYSITQWFKIVIKIEMCL